jgi:putative transposase
MDGITIGGGLIVQANGIQMEFLRRVDDDVFFEALTDGRIFTFEMDDLVRQLISGQLKAIDAVATDAAIQLQEDRSPEQGERTPNTDLRFLRRLAYVEAFAPFGVTQHFALAKRQAIVQVAHEHQDPSPPTIETVTRWQKQLARHDGNRDVLTTQKRGRHSLNQVRFEDLGQHPDPHERVIENGLKAYLSLAAPSVAEAYRSYLLMFEEFASCQRRVVNAPKCAKLSERQFLRRVQQQLIPYEVVAYRRGKHAARNAFRQPSENRYRRTPLEQIQVDDAALRLFVVDDNGIPLGPVWWTGMRCAETNFVLGFFLFFEPPSTTTFLGALRHSLSPRDYMARLFPDIKGKYMTVGLGREYVYDRAKYNISNAMLATLRANHVDPRSVKHYTPWAKHAIEGLHSLIQSHVTGQMAGAIPQDKELFRTLNPEKHAVVKFSTLLWAVHKYVVDVLHEKPNARGQTPNQLIRQHQQMYDPRFPPNPQELDIVTGMRFSITLSNHGAQTHALEYASTELQTLYKRIANREKVNVIIPPNDLRIAYVWDRFEKKYLMVPNRHPEYVEGLTFYQHKLIARRLRSENKEITQRLLLDYKRAWLARLQAEQTNALKRKTVSPIVAAGTNSGVALDLKPVTVALPSTDAVEHALSPLDIGLELLSAPFLGAMSSSPNLRQGGWEFSE